MEKYFKVWSIESVHVVAFSGEGKNRKLSEMALRFARMVIDENGKASHQILSGKSWTEDKGEEFPAVVNKARNS